MGSLSEMRRYVAIPPGKVSHNGSLLCCYLRSPEQKTQTIFWAIKCVQLPHAHEAPHGTMWSCSYIGSRDTITLASFTALPNSKHTIRTLHSYLRFMTLHRIVRMILLSGFSPFQGMLMVWIWNVLPETHMLNAWSLAGGAIRKCHG